MRDNQSTLADAIKAFLKQYKLDGKINEVDLMRSWEGLMGPSISRHTTKIELRGSTLIIKLDSSVLRHELNFAKDKILEKVNEHFGRVVAREIVLI